MPICNMHEYSFNQLWWLGKWDVSQLDFDLWHMVHGKTVSSVMFHSWILTYNLWCLGVWGTMECRTLTSVGMKCLGKWQHWHATQLDFDL